MRGASPALPVANSSSVSEVEVSPSMVTALKVSPTPSCSSACSAGAAIAASVKTKDSIVAMSGAIMPAPLAMPLMRDLRAVDLRRCGRHLREGVGGHDRLGRIEEAARARASSPARP